MMCTAISYKNNYFGRNLDLDFSYGEEAAIVPRNFPFTFREIGTINSHYAIIGVAYVKDGYPLLYDAVNERGLGMAGLNFVGNAVYNEYVDGKDNIAQFEFIPWILSQCADIAEARALLTKINLRNTSFSEDLPTADLHWIISDRTSSIVVEAMADGLKIHDNPIGILANNPPFEQQVLNLSNYQQLSANPPVNNFAPNLDLPPYSRGMGAIGLPGDLSSASRFVRAAFTKFNSLSDDTEMSSVGQFFHILHSVDQQRGCAALGDNKYEITIYSSCYNLEQSVFYYTCYTNHQINSVDMKKYNLNSSELIHQPFITEENVHEQSLS